MAIPVSAPPGRRATTDFIIIYSIRDKMLTVYIRFTRITATSVVYVCRQIDFRSDKFCRF